MAKGGWVAIMANRYRGGIYGRVTVNIATRIHRHREGTGSTHVADFGTLRLVHVERHDAIVDAIACEKLVKKRRWPRKFALVESANLDWHDLRDQWFPDDD